MSEAASVVTLIVDGRKFEGWTTATINMSLDAFCYSFSFEYMDLRRRGEEGAIEEGAECEVKIDRTQVIKGFIDAVDVPEESATGTRFSLRGRSATMDLQDCSALHVDGGGAWKGAGLLQIANDLVSPFGQTIRLGDAGLTNARGLGDHQAALVDLSKRVVKPFRRFAIEPGESVAATLKRLADERGVLFTPAPDGQLAVTLAGYTKVLRPLKRGVNLPAGWARRGDWRDRFSDYIVVGHAAGDAFYNGAKAQAGRGEATDEQVERYRPLVIVHDGSSSGDAFEARARWERNKRAGDALEFSGPVESWLHDGVLWQPNRLVDLRHEGIGANDELLVSTVELTFDKDTGDRGKLTLIHRGARDPFLKPAKKKKRTNVKALVHGVKAGADILATLWAARGTWDKENG